MNLPKRIFAILLSAALLSTAAFATSEKPNILFIFLDDFGWKDTSYMGSDFYESPYIDKLASEGMVFTNAYSASAKELVDNLVSALLINPWELTYAKSLQK